MISSLRGVSLAGLVLLAVAGSAPAQFAPSLRWTQQWGYGAINYNPLFPNFPRIPGRYQYTGITVSGYGANGPYSLNVGYYRTGQAAATAYLPSGGYIPPANAGYGSGTSRVAERQKAAVADAQRNAGWDAAAASGEPAKDFNRWLKDAGDRRTGDDGQPAKIDPALIDPPEEAVLSGEVLNQLSALVREQEKKGKKAKPGLYAPDLTGKMVFAGPRAEAANLYRAAELSYPDPLVGSQYDPLRADLDKAFTPVSKDAIAGKSPNPTDVDRLLRAVETARTAARPVVADAPLAEAASVSGFFTTLETATKQLKGEKAGGIAGSKWAANGATVAEVAAHQAKFGLVFGPAKAGDEAAYYALHRGLLAYYAGLLQAK